MKRVVWCWLWAGLGGALPGLALADIYVICNPAVVLSVEEVKDVYIGEKQLAGSTKLTPLDNSSLQSEFLSKVLKLDGARYESLWTKKSFRDGLNPPQVRNNDADIINAVKSVAGVIGYISSAPPPGVRLVQKY